MEGWFGKHMATERVVSSKVGEDSFTNEGWSEGKSFLAQGSRSLFLRCFPILVFYMSVIKRNFRTAH